jgi:predicted nuclease of predicted toxin-antitoxin system
MPDNDVLRGAAVRDRVLITSDKDFGDLVFRDG